MSNQVVIDFIVKNTPDIGRALRSVAQSMAASEREQTRIVQREAAARLKLVEREAKDKVNAMRKADQEVARIGQGAVRDVERAVAAKARTEARAAQDKVRLMIKTDNDVRRIHEQSQRDAVRSFEKAESQKNASAMKWLRQREREQAQADQSRQRFARATVGAAGTAVRNTSGFLVHAASTISQLGGGYSLADAVQQRVSAQGKAADISNAGYLVGDKNNGVRRSSGEILSHATTAGSPMGFSQTETLGGLSAFTEKAGDLSMGLKILPKLAELARATGSSFEDLGSAAAEAFNSNTKQSAEDIMITMRGLAGMGNIASVEIKNMAAGMAKVTASAGMFSGNRESNVMTLAAMSQEAKLRGGATSAAEALTSVQRFGSDVAKGTSKFDALGIKTKTKEGTLRGPQDIVQDALRKTGGDVSQLSHLFGDRSVKSVLGYADIYRQAGGHSSDPKKQEAAIAAVSAEFDRLRKASLSAADAQERAQVRMGEVDMQFTKAMLDLKEIAAKELIPALIPLVRALVEAGPEIQKVAKAGGELAMWFVNNPFKGIGALTGAYLTKELALAGIGQLIRKILSGGGGGGGGPPPSGVMPAAVAGLATYEIFNPIVDGVHKGQVKGQKHVGELISDMKNGSPEQRAKAAEEFRNASKQYGGTGGAIRATEGAQGALVGVLSQLTGGRNHAAESVEKGAAGREVAQSKELAALVASMNNLAKVTDRAAGGKSGTPNQADRSLPINTRSGGGGH